MRSLLSYIFILLYMLAIGCGSDDSSEDVKGNQTGASNDQATSSGSSIENISCDEGIWQAYVALHKAGSIKAYEMKIKTSTSNGALSNIPEQVIAHEEEVLEANENQIVVKSTTQGHSSTKTTTKKQFLALCETLKVNNLPAGIGVNHKILKQQKESKTVRAGTFDCQYFQIELDMTVQGVTNKTLSETWVTYEESNLASVLAPTTVFSKTTQTKKIQGVTMTTETTDELISWHRP